MLMIGVSEKNFLSYKISVIYIDLDRKMSLKLVLFHYFMFSMIKIQSKKKKTYLFNDTFHPLWNGF